MPVNTVNYQISVLSFESLDHLILAATAVLNDCDEVDWEVGSPQTSCIVESHNSFTQSHTTRKAIGLMGCIRMLASHDFLGHSESQQAQGSSWMQACDTSVLTILRDDKKEEVLEAAIVDFVNRLEDYLFDQNQTYLVGDAPTAADVMVSLSLGAACTQFAIKVPQQTFRWMETTLNLLQQLLRYKYIPTWMSFGIVETNILETWMNQLELGSTSPLEKPIIILEETTTKPTTTTTSSSVPSTPTKVKTSASSNAILQLLDELQLSYEVYDHALCTTAEELVTNVPLPATETHTKNLFLRDKKHGFFLVTVHPSTHVNTKELGNMLNLQGKTNLRLADETLLDTKLHVKPGCVGPLCMGLANPNDKITLALDQSLLKYQYIHSHPLQNDKSVKLTPTVFESFFAKINVEPVMLEFAKPEVEMFTGKVPANRPPATKEPPAKKTTQQQPKQQSKENKKVVKKGETLLALQWKKQENFAQWYSDVIVLSEMISYYDISGCYILRPWSYKMWELIQEWFNQQIASAGIENAYFPLFVSQDRLEREKDHVEGFAPEVAWVTRSGSGDLPRPIAVRPTSETIMYPAYSDWIKSHRDLPLKLNQWSNVVRWEFKYPTPFLRTREFLWQEGHTAHATFEDADETVMQALGWYRGVYEDLLAVPVVPGYKTEKEKFAGGYRTTTVEAYVAGSGRAIQGATSHNLGQNFGKMFDISYQDENGKSQIAWQTSWGLTTRTIGVMVMVHGDDTGLVLPPRVAPLQVVIVPIVSKRLTTEEAAPYCLSILEDLKKHDIRAKYDDRTMYNPGWKYNHWEQKGVPIRIEVGPRDMEQKSARIVIRHDGTKEDHPVEGLGALLKSKLVEIQSAMFEKARVARDSHIVKVMEWKDFVPNLEKNNLVLTPWCGGKHQDWEEKVKEMSREESLKARGEESEDEQTATSVAAKTLCIPFDQPELPAGTKCIASGMDATCWVLWGRSY